MSIQIIQDRLNSYSPQTKQEEENVIKQIYQEISLFALSRAGFFKLAAFQGGTCLRIIYNLNRFSEDLDFILINPDKTFVWEPFLKKMTTVFESFGVQLQAIDRSKAPGTIQRAFLKQNSFGKILQLGYQRGSSDKQNVMIRLEIDTNPPSGSFFSTHYVDFPIPFSIVAQDKPTLFASKCHALLCRDFLKGRDWYDFLWYVSNKTPVNFAHLKAALTQTGHWNAQEPFNREDLVTLLKKRILEIDWKSAAADVQSFLMMRDREFLQEWSQPLFLAYVDKIS